MDNDLLLLLVLGGGGLAVGGLILFIVVAAMIYGRAIESEDVGGRAVAVDGQVHDAPLQPVSEADDGVGGGD